MKYDNLQKELSKMIDVNMPIIAIQDHDFVRIDELILNVAGSKARICEWSPFTGPVKFATKGKMNDVDVLCKPRPEQTGQACGLETFLFENLRWEAPYIPGGPMMSQPDTYLVLKDLSEDHLKNPDVISLLHQMAQRRLYGPDFNTTIIIASQNIVIPQALTEYVSYLEIGVVDQDEVIEEIIDEHTSTNHYRQLTPEEKKELLPSLKGMTLFQIDRMLDMAMSSNGTLSTEDREMILKQKKQMVRKSGLLDLIDTPANLESIGGMDALKKYLQAKQKIFSNPVAALRCRLAVPKGAFIVGMPGCGKSLCAKATAALFKAPLLKLDMGSMMGKYVGQSEENLRKAIRIAEAAAPCVLWIDEIEKAFAGVGGSNSEILTRMFGYFLSWMQEKTSSVYVIATANNADNLPPELKRKGRFDEIFCVNLPNKEERLAIFNVHLKKKGQTPLTALDPMLDKQTDGFNGADIESVVNEALEKKFIDHLNANGDKAPQAIKITQSDLLEIAKKTVSISASCKKQIESMKKAFEESSFKDATTGNMTSKK